MNFEKKYLKYKRKYLSLLELSGNKISQNGGALTGRVNVIQNNGSEEGMVNQCFWISIKDYLRRSGNIPDMTLRRLRQEAGLDATTERTVFDVTNPLFENAANRIAQLYNLQINVYPLEGNGTIKFNGNLIDRINPSGGNIVNIGQYGIYHFNLIVESGGTPYTPAVNINNNFTDINSLKLTKGEKSDLEKYLDRITDLNTQKNQRKGQNTSEIDIMISSLESEINRILDNQQTKSPSLFEKITGFFNPTVLTPTSPVSTPVIRPTVPTYVAPIFTRPPVLPTSPVIRPVVPTYVAPVLPTSPVSTRPTVPTYVTTVPTAPTTATASTGKYAHLAAIPMKQPRKKLILHGGARTQSSNYEHLKSIPFKKTKKT